MVPGSLREIAFAAGATLGLLFVARAAGRVLAPGRGADARSASARGLLQAGHVLGLLAIAAALVAGSVQGEDLKADVLWVTVYGALAAALLEVTARLGIRLLIGTRLSAELDRGNVAAGIAGGAHYAATGVLVSSCIYGHGLETIWISLAWFAIALVTFVAFLVLFRAITTYDDAEEILSENAAAALSYAGIAVSLALIVGHAADGPFEGWGTAFESYGVALLFVLALYPVRQFVVRTVILGSAPGLRGGRMDEGIARERNVGMAALEAATYLATALLATQIA